MAGLQALGKFIKGFELSIVLLFSHLLSSILNTPCTPPPATLPATLTYHHTRYGVLPTQQKRCVVWVCDEHFSTIFDTLTLENLSVCCVCVCVLDAKWAFIVPCVGLFELLAGTAPTFGVHVYVQCAHKRVSFTSNGVIILSHDTARPLCAPIYCRR